MHFNNKHLLYNKYKINIMNQIDVYKLRAALSQLNHPDNQVLQEVHDYILSIQNTDEFLFQLFSIIEDSSLDMSVILTAIILMNKRISKLKNEQCPSYNQLSFPQIKTNLLDLIVRHEGNQILLKQLEILLDNIVSIFFPKEWPELPDKIKEHF